MTWYYTLKIIHVLSASVLFGTGLGTAFYMFYVNAKRDVALIAKATKQVVFADWLFTGTSGVIQAITGFALIYIKQYSLSAFWVSGAILGYCIAGACWLPVVYLQIRCRDMAYHALQVGRPLGRCYYYCFIGWVLLGIPAFLSLIVVYYLMANRPTL